MRRRELFAAAAALTLAGCATATFSAVTPMTTSLAPPPTRFVAGRPAAVIGHPDPLWLIAQGDPALVANKRLAFDLWRSVVDAGHVELADELLTEGYIQHSPVLPTGRAAFKQVFSAVERREIPEVVSPPLLAMLAEKDRVIMALVETLGEPDGSGSYATVHFNMFRVENGRVAEHWHSVQTAPGPDVARPEDGGPQRVSGAEGAYQLALLAAADPELAANKRLVFDFTREALDAGREEAAELYLAADYLEHDPTAGSGRAAFEARMAARPDRPLEPFLRTPLVAMIAEGDLVAAVTMLEHPHPVRPAETYTTTWFDMYRIADGRIVEHWNPAIKEGTRTAY